MPSRLTRAQLKRKLNELRLNWRWIGPSGILQHCLGSKPGRKVEIAASKLGQNDPFWVRVPSTDINVLRQWFDPALPKLEVNPDVKVVVDCGANIGVSARIFAEYFPSAKIIAIELEPANVEMLRKNSAAHPSIEVLHAGLWDKECELSVHSRNGGEWDYQAVESSDDPSCFFSGVSAVTVDGILERYDLDCIDVLKIDIEGSELRVLANSDAWIDRVDTLMVELHEQFAPGCTELFDKVAAQFSIKWGHGELCCASRDGALVQP